MSEYLFVLPIIVLAFLLVFGGLFASRLLATRRPNATKLSTYECGEKTIGSSWIQFNVGYYLFGLIFLVFDLEAAFLYPWAVIVREAGFVGLIEIIVFILIFVLGLTYAWKKGALEWV
jgi:NADH-quinone oxidoreductase subunit A